jgi:glycosyltransferase involved in cell wall biosynthesis
MKSLRVVFLIENISVLRDRRVRQEAAALVAAGCIVRVICPRSRHDAEAPQVVDGMRVHTYYQPWQGGGHFSYFLEYVWSLVCTLCILAAISLRSGFDVLHAANPPDLFFLVATPFRWFGKKFVYDQHDLSPEMFEMKFGSRGWVYKLLLFFERCSYRAANLVIVTNESFRRIAMGRGGAKPAKIYVVRNGPDLARFRLGPPRPELKNGAAFLALYIGVMAEQDGVDRVIRAAHHIIHELGRTDVRFALLGNGDCLDELKQLARLLGVESHVSFPGYLGDTELLAYLSTADVCLAPDPPVTLNQFSTMIKVMEYMSCAKPIVSFDLVETRYSAGDAAIYVARDDPKSFAEAIIELLDDPKRRARMGQDGLERVRSGLNWEGSRQCLLRAYQQWTGVWPIPSPASDTEKHQIVALH